MTWIDKKFERGGGHNQLPTSHEALRKTLSNEFPVSDKNKFHETTMKEFLEAKAMRRRRHTQYRRSNSENETENLKNKIDSRASRDFDAGLTLFELKPLCISAKKTSSFEHVKPVC